MAALMNVGESTAEINSQESRRFGEKSDICKLCLKDKATYTCPRCNLAYCSLSCYRGEKHGRCSESFYKDNFIQALQETKGSSDDKKKVLEMLSRLDSEQPYRDSDDEDEDDVEFESLERRLAGLDLDKDPDKVWEKLIPRERQEFDEILRGGGLGAVLDEWQPWWREHDTELITELESSQQPQDRSEVTTSKPPRVLDSISRLSDLLKTPASPLVVYNLINVLFCYAYVTRLFNGCHAELAVQAVQSVLEACSVLSANASFASVEDSIESAVHTITELPSLPNDRKHLVSVVRDLIYIMLGRGRDSPAVHVKSALSDLHGLLSRARKSVRKAQEAKPSKLAEFGGSQFKSTIFQGKKKVLFYLAWINENPKRVKDKAAEVEMIYKSMEAELSTHRKVKVAVEENLSEVRPKREQNLIEEIS